MMTAMLHLLAVSAVAASLNPLQPTPGAAPINVVYSQLRALQQGDIARCFRFASPANQRNTGPQAKFEMMVRQTPAYSPLVGCSSFQVLSALSMNERRWRCADTCMRLHQHSMCLVKLYTLNQHLLWLTHDGWLCSTHAHSSLLDDLHAQVPCPCASCRKFLGSRRDSSRVRRLLVHSLPAGEHASVSERRQLCNASSRDACCRGCVLPRIAAMPSPPAAASCGLRSGLRLCLPSQVFPGTPIDSCWMVDSVIPDPSEESDVSI